MKNLFFAIVLLSTGALCQNIDYNKIILPSGVQTSDFAEKLVQIAWRNHPSNEVFRRQVNVEGYETKKSAVQWLDVIHVQGNLNQFVLNPGSDVLSRAPFFPKYNVHADMSLSWLFTIPYSTKQGRERVVIAQSQVNAQKLLVRNSVLKSYNEYLMREKVFKIHSQLALDNETSHKLVEQKFKSGQVTFETYSASLTTFSTASLAQLEAERDYKNAKLDLEQLIGMRLEDVR
jgi:outer membrane protein TolC